MVTMVAAMQVAWELEVCKVVVRSMQGAGAQSGNYNSNTYSEMYNANEIKMKLKFALGAKQAEIIN
jgi:hypothetical protein